MNPENCYKLQRLYEGFGYMVLKDISKIPGTGPTKKNCGVTVSVWNIGKRTVKVSHVPWFLV